MQKIIINGTTSSTTGGIVSQSVNITPDKIVNFSFSVENDIDQTRNVIPYFCKRSEGQYDFNVINTNNSLNRPYTAINLNKLFFLRNAAGFIN